MKRTALLPWTWLWIGGLFLAGCGFHLRGAAQIPPQMAKTVIVGISPGTSLYRALRMNLENNGVKVVQTASRASAELKILSWKTQSTILAWSPTGQPAEYQMIMRVRFVVHGVRSTWRLPIQQLETRREYAYSPTNVLGANAESQRLNKQMARELASLMMMHLQVVATNR